MTNKKYELYTNKDGYVYIYFGKLGHPLFPGKNRVAYHRYRMAVKLGRQLLSNETVHHKNENKQDNRLTNLQLLHVSKHISLHHLGSKHSEETKKIISEKGRGVKRSAEFKQNLSEYWKKKGRSQEHQRNLDKANRDPKKHAKISKTMKGRVQSPEHTLAAYIARWVKPKG